MNTSPGKIDFETARARMGAESPSATTAPAKTVGLERLQAGVKKSVPELTRHRELFQAAGEKITGIDAELEQIAQQRDELEGERKQIEGASAVQLHRLGIDAAQAAKRSDKLGAQIEELSAAQSSKSAERERLAAERTAAWSALREGIKSLVNNETLLAQAQFAALLCSAISGAKRDVCHDLEHGHSDLWRSTAAYSICEDRKYRLRHEEQILQVLSEIEHEPIVKISRFPIALNDSQSSNLVRCVRDFEG